MKKEAGKNLDSQCFPPHVNNAGKVPCALGQISEKQAKRMHKEILLEKRILYSACYNDCNKCNVICSVENPKESNECEQITNQISIECEQKPHACMCALIATKSVTTT